MDIVPLRQIGRPLNHSFAEKVALADSRQEYTYKELDAEILRRMERLYSWGARAQDRVVVLASKNVDTVATVLSILRSGAVCVPVDRRTTEARLESLLAEIDPIAVVVDEVGDVPSDWRDRAVVPGLERPAPDEPPLQSNAEPGNLAYIMYTSGSTGRPKGVMISAESVEAFFVGANESYEVDPDSVCLSLSPMHFDTIIYDLWLPLCMGATVHVFDDYYIADEVVRWIQERGITHMSAFGMLLSLIPSASNFGPETLGHLRRVLGGADVPDPKAVKRWIEAAPDVNVANAYGPTEATCAVTTYMIGNDDEHLDGPYPIGAPFSAATVRLVADGVEINEPLVPGELIIAGPQLMLGYWKLDDETRDRLRPFRGELHYWTGDSCHYDDAGLITFLGRKDREMNIGGRRVHPSELERLINSVDGVFESEVFKAVVDSHEPVIVAAVSIEGYSSGNQERIEQQIWATLRRELHGGLLPRRLIFFDEFPRVPSGKRDRSAIQQRACRTLSTR